MKGRLGSLHYGDLQIGGILEWSVEMLLTDHAKDATTFHKLAKWTLTAQSYWLFDIPGKVTVRLYSDGKGYWEGTGAVVSNTKKLFDTLIHEDLEITGEGILEGKE